MILIKRATRLPLDQRRRFHLLKDFDGLCDGLPVNFFFDTDYTEKAISVCNNCPVRKICLENSLQMLDLWGVFGGRTEHQRRKALAVDCNGRATGRQPICPECLSKEVDVVYKTRTTNIATCSSCNLQWTSLAKLKVKVTTKRHEDI